MCFNSFVLINMTFYVMQPDMMPLLCCRITHLYHIQPPVLSVVCLLSDRSWVHLVTSIQPVKYLGFLFPSTTANSCLLTWRTVWLVTVGSGNANDDTNPLPTILCNHTETIQSGVQDRVVYFFCLKWKALIKPWLEFTYIFTVSRQKEVWLHSLVPLFSDGFWGRLLFLCT